MASNPIISAPPPEDLPPPYSAVVGNQQYGFVVPGSEHQQPAPYPQPPRQFTAPGVYPHPTIPEIASTQPQMAGVPPPPPGPAVPIGVVLPPAVGTEPTTITCYNCGKVVTTRVTYTTAWHTHLVAGSVCVITMFCSLCCLGLVPYCFDTFKDAEHYCPNCNTFIATGNIPTTQFMEPPPTYTEANASLPVVHQPAPQATIVRNVALRHQPMLYNCHTCKSKVLTRVEYVNTQKTHILAGFICGVTCWCMLCCLAAIPYTISALKKAKHFCPHCGDFLGECTKF